MVGRHLIADIRNISNFEMLNTLDGIKPLMEKIIKEMNLTVVGEAHKQFEPIGATCLYLLAESHLSAHSYPELRYLAIDLYHCSDRMNMSYVLDIIFEYFNGDCIIRKNIIKR
jgi:S-adenosylmethionine decarboxylase